MSRKQSTVERIRKKKAAAAAAAPSPSPYNDAADPFHNGQTPACRLLLDAVQDIFPELQQQMKHQTASSELGQLLRWQILKRRKERAFPPGPPLMSFSPQSTTKKTNEVVPEQQGEGGGAAAASLVSKKKRKKKKKKKDTASGASAGVVELRTSDSGGSDLGVEQESSSATDDGALNQIQRDRNPVVSSSGVSDDITPSDDDVEIIPLRDDTHWTPDFEPSVHSMDRSVHDLEEERMMLEKAITPTLHHLPSDDGSVDDFHHENNGGGHSSMAYFDQIHQESTEREDDEYDDNSAVYDISMSIPIDSPLEPAKTPPGGHNRPRLRSRTLSASSFHSFHSYEAGVTITPTTKNTAADNDDERLLPMSSPVTHEWVPEEGAEAKTETPPGDAIKNPLELSYLLTLSTNNNSLTTTTIDGSLISAERSADDMVDQKTSSLETTKMLMEDWVGQIVDHSDKRFLSNQRLEEDGNSFINFLQKKLRNGSTPSGIPLPQLKEAVVAIDCISCQQDALAVVDKWTEREEKKRLVMNPSVLQDWTSQDASEVEAAFDYVALEEGHHLPKPEVPDEEDGEDVDLGTHMSFHVAEPSSKKNGTKHMFLDQITPKHLNTLVEDWLPCGIEEEILVATSVNDSSGDCSYNGGRAGPEVLDHEQVTKIQSLVLENEKTSRGSLDEIDQLGKDIRDELDQILSSLPSAPQNLDVKTFPKMKNVDQMCTEFSDKILHFLQSIAGGRSDAMVHLKLRLWTTYLEALNKILKASDSYYSRLGEGLADSRGVLPKPYVDAGFRKLFQGLIEEKVKVWSDFAKFVCDQLRGRQLKELYTRSVWYSERAPATDQKSLLLDEKCNKLVQELADWTATIMAGRMADIYKERMAQTERLLELLQALIEPLAEQYASVEKYFSTQRNLYFASLRSNIVLAQGVKKQMRLIDNAEVEGMATGVMLMWNHVRLMQLRTISSIGIPPLPLQLKRWMLQDESSLMEAWNGDISPLNSYHHRYCQPGRQGKRRVMCILAGLVYRWLEEQCKVWRAEMAEKQLLTDFNFDEPPVAAASAKETDGLGKPAKAKKSKKKKSKSAAPFNDADNGKPQESPSGTEDQGKVGVDGGSALSVGSTDEKKSNDLVPQEVHDSDSETPKAPETPTESSAAPSDDNIQTTGAGVEGKLMDDDNETTVDIMEPERCQSQIVIEDGNRKISAEDFLVSRMRQMLSSNKSEGIVVIG